MSRWLGAVATILIAVGSLAGCGDGPDIARSGFYLPEAQLLGPGQVAAAELEYELKGRGEPVQVATAVVPTVTAWCAPPPEAVAAGVPAEPPEGGGGEAANGCPRPAGAAALSDIPGPSANVNSAQIEGGWTFANPTYFDNPLVFVVVENYGDWLEVMVPTRPNDQTGWIRASEVELSTHSWFAEITLSENRLRVWNGDELVVDTGTVDGKSSTPTPTGLFYYNEKIQQSPTSAYGSWILSTNAFSDSLETFDGGLPVYATHGTPVDAQIGTDISNGCTRIPNPSVEKLAAEMPLGTPVEIVA